MQFSILVRHSQVQDETILTQKKGFCGGFSLLSHVPVESREKPFSSNYPCFVDFSYRCTSHSSVAAFKTLCIFQENDKKNLFALSNEGTEILRRRNIKTFHHNGSSRLERS